MIIRFPGHLRAHCENAECTGCHLCHGGLFLCRTCGSYEGATTTDCPGERMSYEEGERVYAGILDYRRDDGWVTECSPHTPVYYRRE